MSEQIESSASVDLPPKGVIELLTDVFFETFDKSARALFQQFLAGHPNIRRWHIAADFCLHDDQRPYDAFAFTIYPEDADLEDIRADIKAALPRDIKKSRSLDKRGIEWFLNARRFHIGITVPKKRPLFSGFTRPPLLQIREDMASWLRQAEADRIAPERIRPTNCCGTRRSPAVSSSYYLATC
jgi:hypothetical protein